MVKEFYLELRLKNPDSCDNCPCLYYEFWEEELRCRATQKSLGDFDKMINRPAWCPLKEKSDGT